MKRAAWLGCLVVVAALGSAGCAFRVAGQGQGEPVDGTSQGLGESQSAGLTSGGARSGSGNTATDGTAATADKPTPDPWNGLISPRKPTPDPWRPGSGGVDTGSASGNDGSQGTSDTTSTSASQTGVAQTSSR